jgi:ribonuclease HI
MIFTVYIDGAARGNPGPAGSGAYVPGQDGRAPEEHFEALGRTTNNVAEYRALLLALGRARSVGATEVRIFSDSLLLVEQMNGRYKVRAEHLKPLWQEAYIAAKRFSRFSIVHVPRERNRQADRLANRGADESERLEKAAGPRSDGPGAVPSTDRGEKS